MCCERKYLPLRLAFALTVHRCQGLSAGKSKPGQPRNAIQRMVLDVGSRGFEALCPGAAYTGISRATTLGEDTIMNSALFFIGDNLNNSRLINMSQYAKQKKTLLRIRRRNNWTEILARNTHRNGKPNNEIEILTKWANEKRVATNELQSLLYEKHPNNKSFE